MKKMMFALLAVALFSLGSCEYDDDEVWDAIHQQEERIAALEAWQKQANENIVALQALCNENDFIKDVAPIVENGKTIGYTITFLRQGKVNIYHGEKGDKGDPGEQGKPGDKGEQGDKGEAGATPVIGVKKHTDGDWYWTLNGEWLKDAEGTMIRANGKDGADGEPGADGAPGASGSTGAAAPVPQLKTGSELGNSYIKDAVYLSVDGGKTWTKVSGDKGDPGAGGNSIFAGVPQDGGNCWIFPLTNGTEIEVLKYGIFRLWFEEEKNEGGTTSWMIDKGYQEVDKGKKFWVKCDIVENYRWTYKNVSDKVSSTTDASLWKITGPQDNKLEIIAPSDEKAKPLVLLFTVTGLDNQVTFYQVEFSLSKEEAPEGEPEKGSLDEALKEQLGDQLVLDQEGKIDWEASKEVVEKQESLSLDGVEKMEDLASLEKFSNLQTLSITDTPVKDVDLQAFPKLKSLTLNSTEVTTLVVPATSSLSTLNCEGNKQLSTLDVSQASTLTALDCSNNQLTELKLPVSEKLTALYCNNNNITSLDLSQNPNLKEVFCAFNPLTELNLSNLSKLQRLDCSNCFSSSARSRSFSNGELDLSAHPNLTNLYCAGNELTRIDVSKNEKLDRLECDRNQLEKLDVSKNIQLVTLRVNNNLLSTLDIKNLHGLKTLHCKFNRLSALNVSYNTELKDLYCGNQLDENQRNQVLILQINNKQDSLWTSTWKDSNFNVKLTDSPVDVSGGAGTDFGNGGNF